ncbi:MAG TPA: hypothetical protein VH914_00440 [Acidimicrobiia bacterium]|jgi:hypothetical protein|nr:hypothetical protein [Acidimicrobiia bacterium]
MQQLQDVSNILWRERNLLELLSFKLDSERLLARAGRTRWLPRADREVESVLSALKAVELERSIHMHALTDALGLDSDVTLEALAECAPPEWTGIFADHRRALLALARDVDRSARRSRTRRESAPAVISLSSPSEEHGATAVSRAVADLVTPPREQTTAQARVAPRGKSGRARANERTDAVVARIPSLVDFLR